MTALMMNDGKSVTVFRPRDPISALTHFIGCVAAVLGTPVLLIKAAHDGCGMKDLIGLAVFMLSAVQLYGASASYHSFDVNARVNMVLKKIDHISIFYLIAGSYTPICMTALPKAYGMKLMIIVWTIAIAGTVFKMLWVTCPRWVSSVLYIAMGWACVSVLPQVVSGLTLNGFILLLAGGIFYTVGGVIYALKLPIVPKNEIGFGNHELFHLFVMAGTLCHFIMAFLYIA